MKAVDAWNTKLQNPNPLLLEAKEYSVYLAFSDFGLLKYTKQKIIQDIIIDV